MRNYESDAYRKYRSSIEQRQKVVRTSGSPYSQQTAVQGLTRLPVTDDQLTLAAANGDHGVDRLDAGLQRHGNGLSFNDAGCLAFNGAHLGRLDGASAVDGLAQRVHDAADHGLADGNGDDLPGALDQTALADADVRAQHDDADAVLLQIQRHTVGIVFKQQQLVGLALFQSMNLCNAVAHLNDIADLFLRRFGGIVPDLILDDLADVVYFQIHSFTNFILY